MGKPLITGASGDVTLGGPVVVCQGFIAHGACGVPISF
jgi:hypothetical protein